ncbi:MAG: hypothetical protein ACKVHR_11765 [Pirellulales bacterium]
MADPFKPQSSHQLIREAKLGLSVVALLFAILIYVGTFKMTGREPILPWSQLTVSASSHNPQSTTSKTVAPVGNPQPAKSNQGPPLAGLPSQHDFPQIGQSAATPSTMELKTRPSVTVGSVTVGSVNNFQPTGPARNGSVFVVPKTRVGSVNALMTPKIPDSKNVDGNVIRAQFESNQFKLRSPNPSQPATAKTPKIPSFLPPSKQHTPEYVPTPSPTNSVKNQTKPFLVPISILKSSQNLTDKPITEFKVFSNPVNSLTYSDKPRTKFTAPKPIPDANSTEKSLKLQTYKTQTGDTYWSVSEKAYQDGRYFRALFRYNQSMHADYELIPGLELITPAKSELEERWPEECPIATKAMPPTTTKGSGGSTAYHVTSNGDTLFEIARQKLNQASRFVELYQLNPNKVGNNVQPDSPLPGGLILKLPN